MQFQSSSFDDNSTQREIVSLLSPMPKETSASWNNGIAQGSIICHSFAMVKVVLSIGRGQNEQ